MKTLNSYLMSRFLITTKQTIEFPTMLVRISIEVMVVKATLTASSMILLG